MQDVVSDAVALVLAGQDLVGESLALRIVREAVAQQERRVLAIAPRFLEQIDQDGSGRRDLNTLTRAP